MPSKFTIFLKQLRSSAAFGLPLSHWGLGSLHFLTGLDSGDTFAVGDLPSFLHRSLTLQLSWIHGILNIDLSDLALINVNFPTDSDCGCLGFNDFSLTTLDSGWRHPGEAYTLFLPLCAESQVGTTTTVAQKRKVHQLHPAALHSFFPTVVIPPCVLFCITILLVVLLLHLIQFYIFTFTLDHSLVKACNQTKHPSCFGVSDFTSIGLRCKPGPKSGQKWHRILRLLILLIVMQLQADPRTLNFATSGGEGSLPESCGWGEASFNFSDLARFYEAKHHDQAPQVGFCRSGCSFHFDSRIHKRSFRRAFLRASRFGFTWYKGRCFTTADFPAHMIHTVKAAPSPAVTPQVSHPANPRPPRHRFQVVQLNVGGLSSDRLTEIKHWASQLQLDAVILIETRWSLEGNGQMTTGHIFTWEPQMIELMVCFSCSTNGRVQVTVLDVRKSFQVDLDISEFTMTKDPWTSLGAINMLTPELLKGPNNAWIFGLS